MFQKNTGMDNALGAKKPSATTKTPKKRNRNKFVVDPNRSCSKLTTKSTIPIDCEAFQQDCRSGISKFLIKDILRFPLF